MASFGLKVIRGLFGMAEHVIPRFDWTSGLGHRRILADRGVLETALGFVAHAPFQLH